MPDDQQDQGGAGAGADGAGAGAGSSSGDAGAGGQGASGQQGQGQGGQQFSVPEAYKGKGWVSKVKSMDDVYKLVDNLDSLAGKKTVVPDFSKATPEEISAFVTNLRGNTKVEDYKFPEGADAEFSKSVAQILHDEGVPAFLGNKIIDKYSGIARKLAEANVSKEGLEAEWKKSFGDDYKESAGKATNFIKEHLSAEDRALFEQLPNSHLGLVYRLADKVRKAYGASEGKAGEAGAGTQKGGDVETLRKGLRAKMAEMKTRPHDANDYQKLVNDLAATYKQ